MLWGAMDGRPVLVVFGVAVLLRCCTAVAATTKMTTATEDQNQTTSEQNTTTADHTIASTTDPPSSIRTTIAPNIDNDNDNDYSKGLGNGIGIGIGIMLVLVAVTLAVLVTLLWRRQWILPCSAVTGAPAVSSDQVRTVKTKSNGPKTYTKDAPARDEESAKSRSYDGLQMGGPQETYEPLQDVNNSEETYENPDKAPETSAAQAKGAEKELPSQRSQPDGGNAKDELDFYQNYDPSKHPLRTEKGRTGGVPNTPDQRKKKEKKSMKTGPQGSASSDDKQAQKSEPVAAAGATESFYIEMEPRRQIADSIYENTEMKTS